MTSNEFALLAALASGAPSSRRALAARTGLSSGSVGRTLKAVEDAGLVRDGALTQTGFDALEPYRVRNAVVMAAGLSSRCAPISYEKPKGLLRVRGERLIERQIRQLREAGIEDVTVVVGYKKEEFFYLEDAFGVDIVVNEDFAVRNNHATLFQVRDLLGATYVCSSDNYFTENPFEPYAYESYCAAVYIHGETDEYCLGTRGKERRIVSAALGGRDSWALMGHAYWTPSFAEAFMSILEAEYDKPETAPKLWEEVFFSHADELKMVMRPYPADVVHEFDSLDQLQSFDPEFIDNVGSGVLDNICSTLGCLRGDIVDVRPLQQGLTNLSFYFSCGGEGYVYRHPGAGTDDIINRQAETFALKAASDLGLDETYVYEDPRQGWKIARFVPGCSEFDYADAAQVERALKMARRLHTSGVVSPWSFDFYDESKKIEGLLREAGWEFPSDYDALAAAVADLVGPLRAGAGEPVLCHNDFYGPNILVHGDEMSLIDWEYAAMGDYGCDFGNFVAQGSGYTVEEAIAAIPRYFGRMPTPEEEFHLLACTALVGWYWYVWALYKECKGAPTGEWLYVWYKAAKEFGAYANGLLGRPGAPAGPAAAGGAPSLSYDEFTVLAGLEAAARGAVHPEAIDPDARTVALAALEERGLVREGALTDAGASALEPYRVERAVLLAAGFGSRLLPVTVNTPKPLARVHGVRIIDRLIDAVQAAGIKEVYVVRGLSVRRVRPAAAQVPRLGLHREPALREDQQHQLGSRRLPLLLERLRVRKRPVPAEPFAGERLPVPVELPGHPRRAHRRLVLRCRRGGSHRPYRQGQGSSLLADGGRVVLDGGGRQAAGARHTCRVRPGGRQADILGRRRARSAAGRLRRARAALQRGRHRGDRRLRGLAAHRSGVCGHEERHIG
ncbi:NTP transferase domain-containing protein [Eggerthella lenta]|uniref:NTP transferase domain-containing protein n=1 Tax=Eggerthella lenta TaxID=84112 RepID=UPI0021631735|nr:NTP transferase domain-containing protein [Eggerthella lenta]